MKRPFINKEISWLSFNERVLQEAEDPSVPLISRLRFLGIYSSNMDEFFRVRVATLRRLSLLGGKKYREAVNNDNPKKILARIQKIFVDQHLRFDAVYNAVLGELSRNGIHVVNELTLPERLRPAVKKYFRDEVRPRLFPQMIGMKGALPELTDKVVYLFVALKHPDGTQRYSIIELPTDNLPRYVIVPSEESEKYVIMLDDVIRCGLEDVFSPFDLAPSGAYSIKIIRDAELDIESDLTESMMQKVNRGLKKRKQGNPVRFSYDASIPSDALNLLLKKMGLKSHDSLIPGGRYNNYKDLGSFPDILPHANPSVSAPVNHPLLSGAKGIIREIENCDILLHFPYHPFDHYIDLLREAAIDPDVSSIRVTLYRLARHSNVVNALINARRNGKQVTVIMELQARFDEEANIHWADRLREEGAHVIYGVYGLKVHSKLCLIERSGKRKNLVCVGTGNFNESTAKVYTDCMLMTSHRDIAGEVRSLFEFFEHNYKVPRFDHLIVSPFYTRKKMVRLVRQEIDNARAGREAYIYLKLNNLSDPSMVDLLYDASTAGVNIRLVVRGMFSVVPGIPGISDRIEAVGIVDRYLEHSRVLIFCNNGNPEYYISSADWLPRNFDHRIEVTCPVYDEKLRTQLRDLFDIAWRDNIKARVLDADQTNSFRISEGEVFCSQIEFRKYLAAAGEKGRESSAVTGSRRKRRYAPTAYSSA